MSASRDCARRNATKIRIFGVTILVAILIAIGALIIIFGNIITAARGEDKDLATLVQLSVQATQRAQEVGAGPILRQIDIDHESGAIIFRFTDAAGTQEIAVTAPTAETAADQWQVVGQKVSPLVSHPPAAINLGTLQVGPAAAASSIRQYRSDAGIRTLTLVDAGGQLVWYVFGHVAEGDISGMVSNASGTFELLGPGPIERPQIAPASQ